MFAVVQVILFVFSAIYCPCKLFCKICVRVMETNVKKIPHVEFWKIIYGWLLYFDLRPGQKNAVPRWCSGRRWHILMAVMRGNHVDRNWLMKWDELKNSHGTLIDWCTGREWPLNCMTVIFAGWRSIMPFQNRVGDRADVELLYNLVKAVAVE